LFVGLDMMNAFVTGKFPKEPDIFFGESSFPCDDIANVHHRAP
jgi:hypothetical protein